MTGNEWLSTVKPGDWVMVGNHNDREYPEQVIKTTATQIILRGYQEGSVRRFSRADGVHVSAGSRWRRSRLTRLAKPEEIHAGQVRDEANRLHKIELARRQVLCDVLTNLLKPALGDKLKVCSWSWEAKSFKVEASDLTEDEIMAAIKHLAPEGDFVG